MDSTNEISRRGFTQIAALTATGLLLSKIAKADEVPAPQPIFKADLRVAIIGVGSQGRNLMTQCLRVPGIRVSAIAEIWPYHQRYADTVLKKHNQTTTVYEDHRELLAKEKEVDAVIIASPDFMHADHTVDALKAGKHVYCEKQMSNSLEGCRRMVAAQRETGKLLQIGYQRRSNPRYLQGLSLIKKDRMLGKVTHVHGHWNRARAPLPKWPKGEDLDAAVLKRFGYGDMNEFKNWKWFKKYSQGAMGNLGSHQVDVFNWFLDATPSTILAMGGVDHYNDREWFDNLMVQFEYPTPQGLVRAFYQVINTSSYGGFTETFMGEDGTLAISEDSRIGHLYREAHAQKKEWEDDAKKVETMGTSAIQLKVGESLSPEARQELEGKKLKDDGDKSIHQLHLENFFSAIVNKTPLSCPPETAYKAAVAAIKTNEAIAAGMPLRLKPEDFQV